MKLVTRNEWGARPPKGDLTRLATARGVKIHYVGSRVNPSGSSTCGQHCLDMVRGIQAHHMDGNGWTTIAYNLLVCEHGTVFEGRGAGWMSAANGPGLNSAHYAVCALLGDKGLTEPSDAMLNGLVDAIRYLRNHGAGLEVKGHRDGYSTSCPGDVLYAWVKRGAPRPGGSPPPRPAHDHDDNPIPEFQRTLRLRMPMMRGDDVRTWQAGARRFIPSLDVDGVFGADSRRAAETVQRTARMPINGVVDAETWLLTWVWEPEPPKEKKP